MKIVGVGGNGLIRSKSLASCARAARGSRASPKSGINHHRPGLNDP